MNKPLLEIRNLSLAYGRNTVLENVTFTIFKQDFIGLIGPNGGGKTTLIKAILGLIRPLRGEIIFPPDESTVKMGYMPQIQHIDRSFPIVVSEVVASGLIGEKNMSKREKRNRTLEIIIETGLEKIASNSIGTLSGGQLQKVLLARAVISRPTLLLLDEPNVYLDKRFEKQFYELLAVINRTTAIVLASHDIGAVISNAKNIASVNGTLKYHNGTNIDGQWLEENINDGDPTDKTLKKC
ncbi:MAG: ATP-binding cassette domain-containing protein [Dysgonamonadaceae bacterium]|jgi:zinc transport system ATP-binding protein|nr:ATP-binding cassette domain-containing protein [Dysgonamonadaceae bacterium]